MQVIKKMKKMKRICQKSTTRLTKWNSSKNFKSLGMKQSTEPARKHSHRKDKPELCMEQGKCKEALRKEAKTLPPRNVGGESDDKRNSRVSLETMDIDQCVATIGLK